MARFFARRINTLTENIKYSKSWDSSLKHEKENNQKNKDARKRGIPRFNWSTSLLHPEKHTFVRIDGKEPKLLEPILYKFIA